MKTLFVPPSVVTDVRFGKTVQFVSNVLVVSVQFSQKANVVHNYNRQFATRVAKSACTSTTDYCCSPLTVLLLSAICLCVRSVKNKK